MPVVAVVGAQWGDEGKGKVIDLLAAKARVVGRYSGGNNAGHTVVNEFGRFGLHLVPSGIFHAGVDCIIGNGVVVHPAALLEEIDTLQAAGISTERLHVSDRAHVVMPYHLQLDRLEEERRGAAAVGTTGRGIGPAFADKAARHGVRMASLLDEVALRGELATILELKNAVLTRVYGAVPIDLEETARAYLGYGERLAPHIHDVLPVLRRAVERDDVVLLEGAQGAMLDPDFGTYPFVTASSPLAGGALLGLGLRPRDIGHVIGVYKAYTTRVGAGPMPTELHDAVGQTMRDQGHEYGTTTGRPRRCGWFDGVVARHTAAIGGFTAIAVNGLDVLDSFETVKICVDYELGGRRVGRVPASAAELARCQPVYEELEGWRAPTGPARALAELPPAARAYLRRVEELTETPLAWFAAGRSRDSIVETRVPF